MYISLVNHSHYSVLEGYGTVQEYIAKAKQLGMPALGLTDKGTAMGLFTFIKECNKNDVTPLPGLELFVRDDEDDEIYNLHLLATSNKGMRSITKLVSLSWLEENYNVKQERPTVLLQDLINYQEDLIVLSGNQDSQISTYITNEKYDKAIEIASRLKDVFKDNFYIELAIGTKNNLNKLVELAEELNIKTVITPGVYYTEKDEWEQHEVFLAINSKSKMEETPQRLGGKRKSLDSTSHWFMSEKEIRETVRQFNIPEEAYSNTFEIYEKIKNGNIRFINNPQLRPHVEVPEKYNSEFDYFKGLVKEGFLKKRGTASKDVQKESLKRIAYETDVLKSGNFVSYFLTTADLVKESHRKGHNTGLGRGCFLPGNNVRMTRGIDRPIENIKVGDSVLTHDTKSHKVLNTMKYYIEEECIKITLNNGKEITCTTDHKIFKKDFGFIEAKDLLVGDTLLGAKRNSEITGTLTCVGKCGKTREFNVKTGRHLFGPSYYKQSGEWICNDCRNKQNYKHPIIMQTFKENAERQTYDEEYKQRMSQALKDHWAENYDERINKFREWVNSDKSLGWRKSLSEANYRRYSDPKEAEKLKFHKNNYKKGWMYDIDKSTKNPIWYDSSYEQKAINILNTLSEVKQFARYKHSESITYYDKETGRERQYIPDFVISLKDDTKVILEVKSLWDIDRQRNQDKFEAAYNFVENSDKYDRFIIWTENELEELSDFLHHEFTIKSIEFFDYKGYVYDIEVEDIHNYTIEGVTVHNSAGGSEIAYLLDIHETDPIKFDLMFDRFLSKGRFSIAKLTFNDGTEEEHMISDTIDGKYVHQIEKGDKLYNGSKTVTNYEIVHVGSSPDVDTDYHTQIRDDIINYSKEKYGIDRAANIITFNTMLAKGAFRDIAARYGIYPSDYNNISKAIPDSYRDPLSTLLDENNPDGEELRATLNRVRDKYINNALTGNEKKAVQEKFDKIIKFTDHLHNRIKSVGAHPAGVIISSVDLSEVVPVRTDPKDFKHIIEWEYPDCEYLGLIKWDFLGLNTINIIEGAIDNVNENYNIKLDMKDIIDNKLNDPKAINVFKTAQTETIFQYSGGGVKELLSNLRPDNFDEVAAVTAIFRPGPMSIGYHTSFVNRKNGTEELIPLHKEFEGTVIEEILEPTLNQLIYQEQVLQIAQRAAGFTATEADKFRRAIGKKDTEVMTSMKIKFIEGIKNNLHVSDDALTTLWDGILGFSAYAFNKCLKYDTYVYLKDSSIITIKELYKRVVEQGEEIEILSMFGDGSIKPHKVSTVHDTGKQEIWTIITENNKSIKLTKNHRMLTNNGYGTIENGGLSIDTELVEDNGNTTKIKEIILPNKNDIYQTYDIEMVSEPRNFLANGLVSHNSHSISYALTAYVSAWLKAYYPAEYMASAIEAVSYNPKSFKPYISEAKRMGIEVLVPDINLGKVGTTATKEGKILIGLCNIKGVNTGQVKAILKERQKSGLFKDIYDFIERCHSIVSQGNLEKLIQAGAFDSLGYTRKGLILTLPELYKAIDSKDKISNSLFSLFEDSNNDMLRSITISQDEYPYVEKLGYEVELLSNYLSGQPLNKVLTKTIEEQAYQNFKVYAPEKTFKTHCIVTEFKKVKSGAYYIEFTDGVNTFRSFTDDNVSQLIDTSLKKKNKNNLDLYQGTLLSTNRLDLKENNAYTFTLRNRSYNKNYYNKNSNEVQMVYRFDIINIEELYLDLLGNPIDIYTVTDDNYEEFIQMCDSMKNGAKRIGYKIEIPEQNIFLVKQYTTVDSVLYNREYSRDLSSKFGHYHVLDNYN